MQTLGGNGLQSDSRSDVDKAVGVAFFAADAVANAAVVSCGVRRPVAEMLSSLLLWLLLLAAAQVATDGRELTPVPASKGTAPLCAILQLLLVRRRRLFKKWRVPSSLDLEVSR